MSMVVMVSDSIVIAMPSGILLSVIMPSVVAPEKRRIKMSQKLLTINLKTTLMVGVALTTNDQHGYLVAFFSLGLLITFVNNFLFNLVLI